MRVRTGQLIISIIKLLDHDGCYRNSLFSDSLSWYASIFCISETEIDCEDAECRDCNWFSLANIVMPLVAQGFAKNWINPDRNADNFQCLLNQWQLETRSFICEFLESQTLGKFYFEFPVHLIIFFAKNLIFFFRKNLNFCILPEFYCNLKSFY